MRRLLACALSAALLLCGASLAAAAVHVRVAVDPPTIPQCTRAHLAFAIGNNGTDPVVARLGIELLRGDQVLLGPIPLRRRLAAGEQHSHEFDFFMLPVPAGRYALRIGVQASDGSTDTSTAAFEVILATPPNPCARQQGAESQLLLALIQGLASDTPTATDPRVWGTVKELYR
jgi:hypothetical protein